MSACAGPFEEELLRARRAVPPFHPRHVVGRERGRRTAEPLEVPLVAGRPVDLDVPVAPVADDGLDGALVADDGLVLRPDGAKQRAVDEPEVVAVAVVLGEHLPVRRAAVLHPSRGQRDLTLGREIARAVDQLHGLAEVLLERDAVGAQAREDEPAVAGHARRAREPARALVERGIVAARVRHAEQRAAQVVRPPVVRTRERPRGAAIGRADHGAAMPAAVEEHRDLSVAAAHHDGRLRPERPRDEVAGVRNLARVADEHPAAMEDPLHLVGEDARVGVEGGVDAVVADQLVVAHDPVTVACPAPAS